MKNRGRHSAASSTSSNRGDLAKTILASMLVPPVSLMLGASLRKFLLLLRCEQAINLGNAVLVNVFHLPLLLVFTQRIIGFHSLNLLLLILPDLFDLGLLLRGEP